MIFMVSKVVYKGFYNFLVVNLNLNSENEEACCSEQIKELIDIDSYFFLTNIAV